MDGLWIQTCIFSGLYAINGFPTYLSLTVYRAFLSPESTYQRFVAPFIWLLQRTPGGWFLPKIYKAVWTTIWVILPSNTKAHRAWMSIDQPLPRLLNGSGSLFEKFSAASMGPFQRWVCLSFALCLVFSMFVIAISITNFFVVWALGIICRLSDRLPDMLVERYPWSNNTVQAIQRRLPGFEELAYSAIVITIGISICVSFVLLCVAADFIQAARDLGVRSFT
jgi:hypothetical protein